MKRRFLALALALCLLGACVGCSTTQAQINEYNATLFVQGVLDETYTGIASDGYLKLMGSTAEEVQAAYRDNLEAEFSQRLAVRFQLDEDCLTKELQEDFLRLLAEVYAKASYTVGQATALSGGRYCVEVSVTPVTFFQAAYDDGFAALRAAFEKEHSLPDEKTQASMDAAQLKKATQRFERLWAQEVYDYLFVRLDAVTTGPAVTKLALVTPESNGQYTLSPTDLQDIDDLVLQY